ncbi:MAG: IS1 family transposase [Plectolyngbya sp. WJT66-NPBG17]|jgi:IS1 family transposase/transposase-like protein|nr:IS1 family transposase [Plectolyngbya sp. WJT66-NPBG17]
MVLEPVLCPNCKSSQIVKHGKTAEGKQRYKCCNPECSRHSFILNYSYRGYLPIIKQQISDLAMNGSGIRDTARVLKISPTTVIEELKKGRHLEQVNRALLEQLKLTVVTMVNPIEEAEADEMWSFVQSKKQQRWLWHAIDHKTGQVLAYVLADHKDQALVELKALLEPFGIQTFYTDGWGAYARLLNEDEHQVGKSNTQKIGRKHLTLRTRIKQLTRKTICFSKSEWLHDVVIGLFINRYEFGRAV